MRQTVPIVVLVLMAAAFGGVTASAAPEMGSVVITASNPGDQFVPAVAWDHEHKRWLAVWEQDVSGVRKIVGRLVTNNGSPLGNSFFISDAGTDQTEPDVVYDPGHDRYLVVWVHEYSASDTDLHARFIPWTGLDETELPFAVEIPDSLQLAPAVEYAPFPVDEYLVVWQDVVGFNPAAIRGRRLYPDSGSAVAVSFAIAGDTTYERWNPRVAWNADAGRYLVIYERFQGGAEEDVYAASLSYSGTVFTSDLGIAGFAAEENQVDVAACDGTWMTAWKGGQGAAAQVYVRPVAGDLTLGSITNVSAPTVDDRWPALACNPHGHQFFLVWQKTFSNLLAGVVGALIDADGSVRDSFNIEPPPAGSDQEYTRPAVSVGDYLARAFVIWEADRADLVHQDLAGRWVAMGLLSDGFETGDTTRWSAVVP